MVIDVGTYIPLMSCFTIDELPDAVVKEGSSYSRMVGKRTTEQVVVTKQIPSTVNSNVEGTFYFT